MNDLDSLVQSAESEFTAAATPAELENAKARFLGKTGRVTELLKGMAALSVDELPEGVNWSYELKLDGYRAVLIKNPWRPPIFPHAWPVETPPP